MQLGMQEEQNVESTIHSCFKKTVVCLTGNIASKTAVVSHRTNDYECTAENGDMLCGTRSVNSIHQPCLLSMPTALHELQCNV